MSDSSKTKQNLVPGQLVHFARAIAEFNDKMKISSRLPYLEGDERIEAEALLYMQRISTLDS